jgi:thiol-disulfide isomerase/thioredoxin
MALLAFGASAPVAAQQNPRIIDLPAPPLVGTQWLNTTNKKPIVLDSRKGKVTIVHFWTFGCINCKRNLPAYARWEKKFSKKGVTIIGVHTPETDEEKITENVVREVKQIGINYPVLIDEKGKNWSNWEQQYWPTVYLLDKRGHVRAYWVGELEWNRAGGEAIMTRKIEQLLREPYREGQE